MENNEEGGEEPVTRGNEWEVVSLTESAYGAAPGPKEDDPGHNRQVKLNSENEAETSTAIFMSGHFIFPPSQHENLPLEPENVEIQNEERGKDDASQLIVEEGDKSYLKDEENSSIKGLMPDEFSGIPTFDGKCSRLPVRGTDFKKDLAYEEQSIYSSAAFSSVDSEADLVDSNMIEDIGRMDDMIEGSDHASDSSLCSSEKIVDGDNYDDYNLPCGNWWRRRAISLYAHAKEANTFWSICIAAAVMGLVIIGHRWQQERWQILHHKWLSGIKHERMGMMLGPMTRLKDVIVGGHRRGSVVRGNSSI
ncbi:ATG8-interacting protein 1-like [Primulina huaijiensis]|uniref:ATG8-interacting protein 1-like n=1 Tax=Primulina huaijiensis TaxID=1492673 RepID=UPI003CC76D7F